VQNETFSPQANEIPNTAASWLPGDDYYTNFHEGDPFLKVSEGYARLPGAGYEALHPELEGLDPEDYPDIHKMAILADVAPYSREYHTYRQMVGKQAQGNTELKIEYEKILKAGEEDQVFPSCRNQNASRAPDQSLIHDPASRHHGSLVRIAVEAVRISGCNGIADHFTGERTLSPSSGMASSNGLSVLPDPKTPRARGPETGVSLS